MVQDSKLLSLQVEMSEAASVYHLAVGEYLKNNFGYRYVSAVCEAGEKYHESLERVRAHLIAARVQDTEELGRVERLLELLRIELDRLSPNLKLGHYQIC